ncbi:SHUGOSHIN 1-like [Bidens hawaiensis]|uniref:SHUGOSHIN 1-like n=1 Tax=Bidens hawaiensis TaxID=980011 RepID=UPI00404965D6
MELVVSVSGRRSDNRSDRLIGLGTNREENRIQTTLTRDNKSKPNSSSVKEFIEQLQKENASLMKLLGDKNRIIDVSGAELHKLRITLQKMQQHNLHLAQSNSQMLAELNSGKDRLKDLQHQLGCKNGLLIAKEFELEGKRKAKACETNETKKVKVSEHDEMGVCTVAESGKDQHCNSNGRQKSKSSHRVEEKVLGDNRRVVARRQSAWFKHDEPKPTEDLFHTDKMDNKTQEDDKAFYAKKEVGSLQNIVTQESRRSSVSRPSREVAKKVQSYKEISVNVKMRRPG